MFLTVCPLIRLFTSEIALERISACLARSYIVNTGMYQVPGGTTSCLTCLFNIIGEVKISVKCWHRNSQPYILIIFICSYDSYFDYSKDAPYTRKANFYDFRRR
jgi:hypothetical protein